MMAHRGYMLPETLCAEDRPKCGTFENSPSVGPRQPLTPLTWLQLTCDRCHQSRWRLLVEDRERQRELQVHARWIEWSYFRARVDEWGRDTQAVHRSHRGVRTENQEIDISLHWQIAHIYMFNATRLTSLVVLLISTFQFQLIVFCLFDLRSIFPDPNTDFNYPNIPCTPWSFFFELVIHLAWLVVPAAFPT